MTRLLKASHWVGRVTGNKVSLLSGLMKWSVGACSISELYQGRMTFEIGGLWPFDKRSPTAWIHNIVPFALVVRLRSHLE